MGELCPKKLMKKWNELNAHDRSEFIKLMLDHGISNLDKIRHIYASGGNISDDEPLKGNQTKNYVQSFGDMMYPIIMNELRKDTSLTQNQRYTLARNLIKQYALESEYGRSSLARKQNNFGGVKEAGKETYRTYTSPEDFVKDHVGIIKVFYPEAYYAEDEDGYAAGLMHQYKNGKLFGKAYHTTPPDQYASTLKNTTSLQKAIEPMEEQYLLLETEQNKYQQAVPNSSRFYARGGKVDSPDGPIFVGGATSVNPNYQVWEDFANRYPIEVNKPSWQRGLTNYDWARARQYYSDADGNLTNQGIEFLKNISSKRTNGQSNFMRDVNKLSYIPNAAVGVIGAIPIAAGLIASAPVVAEAASPYVRPTVIKNLAGLGLSMGAATGIDQIISDNSDYKSLPDWANQTFFDGSPETEQALEFFRPEYIFAPYTSKVVNKGIRLANNGYRRLQETIPTLGQAYQKATNASIKPSLNQTSYNFSIDDKRFINDVAGYSGYDVKNAMLKLRERFGDLIIPERWLDVPERAARILIDSRLADFNMGLKTKFIPKGMNYDKINNQFQNIYFKNGEILPEFNNDITITNIPKTTEAVINNQTLPRLMLDEDRKYLLGRNDSFVEDFTFDFDKSLQSKYYWPSNELWNAFPMNKGKGGYYVPKKQRVVIPKVHNYTTPTHETIHSIEEQIPRTSSENKLLESYGSIPMGERGPTNAEIRQRVLDKMNVDIKSSLKEQNNAIDKISDEDLIEILKTTNGYAQKAVQNESINKKSLSGIREAMKKVGTITGIIGTGAQLLNNNKN